MDITAVVPDQNSTVVPVLGLSFYAMASGYLMSLIPLSLHSFGLSETLTPWLVSGFYLGLLMGATQVESIISKLGHRRSLLLFLSIILLTTLAMIALPSAAVWLVARLIAGFAVAGVFVAIESWLLMVNTAKQRAKRLGLYMASLYGGTALGQLGIGPVGIEGVVPYLVVITLLLMAIMPPLMVTKGQPAHSQAQPLSFAQLKEINRAAMLGCFISGMLLAPIYGLMPVFISDGIGTDKTGILMASIIIGGMLVQPIISLLSPVMSKKFLMSALSLIGVAAVAIIVIANSFALLAVGYMLLGACTFALYPIAITLACDALEVGKIVITTQIMLLSYSVGSVFGPLLAFQVSSNIDKGLLLYLAICLITSGVYMLIKAIIKMRSDKATLAG
ncbi:putative MFS-type transporter YcaD [Sinobacterium norvegicum]|uniref:MFS-type transporter YcaD n=1 Tax=Sinobacterium norvegicum TaxID=1641715 RepID=A0ABN8EGA5_9GAMM|nr:MFS transporter [Sinobacterium norvegicum]CAH0990054.1 putative MFS-type transporter YcaD [Sinobacterium norvegicum]